MSFLDENSFQYVNSKITKNGRMAIANGNFVISYFQVGDSEYDYSDPFNKLDGQFSKPSQKVFSPFDLQCDVKYPYKLDSSSTSTTYGVPVQNSYTETIRNVMGPAGFVTNYIEYDPVTCDGTIVKCTTINIDIAQINGTNTIQLPVGSGSSLSDCEYVTVVFSEFLGADPNAPVISAQTNSLIYKIVNITGDTLTVDRPTPDLSSLSPKNIQIVCNGCSIEYPNNGSSIYCSPIPTDALDQHDPWTLNIVWGEYPIGYTGLTTNNLTGYTGNKFVSTKQFLGYTTSLGQNINSGTTFVNSYNEEVEVLPEEQRVLAILHYSELGDIVNDPERFFKYDDYISTNDSLSDSIVDDPDGNPLTDTEYFEIYIPFICYHRNTGTTVGALFHMDTTDYYVTTPSTIKESFIKLPFRYLLDEQGFRVGRVFYTNRTVVFDDQDLVAILDYRSNRKYTLAAPKVFFVPSNSNISNSLIDGTLNQSFWITYTFTTTGNTGLNGLPSNYYVNVSTQPTSGQCQTNIPSNLAVKFENGTFKYMQTLLSGFTNGFVGMNFKILVQETPPGIYPSPDSWKEVDFTTEALGNGTSFLNPTNLEDYSFIIKPSNYSAATFYNIEDYIGAGYFAEEPSTDPKFGDEQPFPGSIRFVRASDVEVMRFMVNLPSTQFTETQNPTYISGLDKKMTDITLLDSNKNVLVVSKFPKPITRSGAQVFGVKLDF
jgi:hypothetical protein